MRNLFLGLLFLTLSSNIYAQKLANVYKEIRSSVVVIHTKSTEIKGIQANKKIITQEGQGSGVLISNEGLIWTAAHVVQSVEDLTVEFVDGDKYSAEVLSSIPHADVALIKIRGNFNLKKKKVAPIGSSDHLQIGEDVFILGAPHGFKQSLTRGILSGRFFPDHISNDFNEIELLQTDAAINPGNSGGPMFNMKGEVVGITSSIYTTSGGFQGIGFVVSSKTAQSLLMSDPNFWTGMDAVLISGDVARVLNLPQEAGLLITHTSSKGLANKLGLQGGYIKANIEGVDILLGGDIILEVAGIKLSQNTSMKQIKDKLNSSNKGDLISIKILRAGKIVSAEFPKQ